MGISSIAGMRKNDLISAIKERQGMSRGQRLAAAEQLPLESAGTRLRAPADAPTAAQADTAPTGSHREAPAAVERSDAPVVEQARVESLIPDQQERAQQERAPQDRTQEERAPQERDQEHAGDTDGADRSRNRRRRPIRGSDASRSPSERTQGDQSQGDQSQGDQTSIGQNGNQNATGQSSQNVSGQNGSRDDDDEAGRRRGRRFRDRNRRSRGDRSTDRGSDRRDGGELEVREDDVLLPVAGILDVLDNYAFVRTSGYLSGPNDVYVSLSLVRKYSLRRGDAITGAVRQPRDGEQQRQKFNPLVRVDSINGLDVEQAKQRPEFTKLTPLYPNDRLRLETEQGVMTTRVIDLIMPIGKGQRALIVSPPKAGKTMILQALANAITTNNPECHLMVVLVDERPEEVTDMQRSVKGEVIASTFDRPPSDHTTISELAIERAKRLVEMGHDVVVLLDSITRLGRAYNLAAPASGRILSGGVDSTALYPPKRFLGAARNIEDGGSLTIFATALVETGSTMDTVIFEEFKGTGNAELKLDRKIADKRIFPAIDINPSGTRKEELLLSPDELAIHHKLRRVLSGLESQQAIDLVLDRLRKTRTNIEFLMQVSKSAAGTGAE
jgi:transcription termination factor Rho